MDQALEGAPNAFQIATRAGLQSDGVEGGVTEFWPAVAVGAQAMTVLRRMFHA